MITGVIIRLEGCHTIGNDQFGDRATVKGFAVNGFQSFIQGEFSKTGATGESTGADGLYSCANCNIG